MSSSPAEPATPRGATSVGEDHRRRGGWLIPVILAVLAAILLAALLSRCGSDDGGNGPAGTTGATSGAVDTSGSSAPTSGSSSGTTPSEATGVAGATSSAAAKASPTSAGAGSGSGAAGGEAGTVTSDGSVVLDAASARSLAPFVDQPVEGHAVTVQSVPADEGFWVGTDTTKRLWVQLSPGGGESPYQVKVGDRVDFTGKVTAHDDSFAAEVGVNGAEGAQQLSGQAAHIVAEKGSVTFAR